MPKNFDTFAEFVYSDCDFEDSDLPLTFAEEGIGENILWVLAYAKTGKDLEDIREAFEENNSDFEAFAYRVTLAEHVTGSCPLSNLLETAPELEIGDEEDMKERAWEYLEAVGLPRKLRHFIDLDLVKTDFEQSGDWVEIEGTWVFNANAF